MRWDAYRDPSFFRRETRKCRYRADWQTGRDEPLGGGVTFYFAKQPETRSGRN